MPTVNRSSNTEMVSVPRVPTREMLNGVCMHPDLARSLWSALLEKAPQPAPQPHPEPIAWMVGTAFWWTKEEAERDAAETGLPIVGLGPLTDAAPAEQRDGEPVAWLAKTLKGSLAGTLGLARYDQRLNPDLYEGPFPVFRHADPGEVERLREALIENKKAYSELEAQLAEDFKHIDDLRAQLAERDALLREADEFMYIMTAHDGHAKLAHRYGKDWWDAIDKLRGKVCTALSASAEPQVKS
ncbi:hypothetical protein [Pseudomonas sp. PNPG3]|uniref:hypothetical protein n=1 Tax=Pseudomonas sp. PNPG3 TaxID=2919497 RepID=UPI001FFDA819|nr:hypothetical protein [Pseudomonas sp. PNPG3]MCK2120813.1 hypothetical protein [Pseudomonas sp. PNPG3]